MNDVMYSSINPYTEELSIEYQVINEEAIQSILVESDYSFKALKKTSFKERAELLTSIATHLKTNKNQLASIITQEMGKPISQSIAEIEKCASVCEYYAENGEHFLKNNNYMSDYSSSYTIHQPLGVVLAIMPWNFPFWQVFRFFAPAIMAGNIALLKHAPNVPQCALAIEELINSSSNIRLISNLFISNEQTGKVIQSSAVSAVTLTGSEIAGASVASIAGASIKKCVLELGGSDPFIVLQDADIENSVDNLILSRFLNSGQSCIAAKRLIIHNDKKDDFINRLKEKVEQHIIGDPRNPETFMGPIARIDLRDKLIHQISEARKLGDKVTTIGEIPKNGFFIQPTIIENIHPQSPAASEELFGPVLSVFSFTSNEQALSIANDTPYGLGASVWTSNPENTTPFIEGIEAGAIFVNDFVKSSVELPFGGIKKSGYGRELSDLGIREFVNTKTVAIR